MGKGTVTQKRDYSYLMAIGILCVAISLALEGVGEGAAMDFVRGFFVGVGIATNLGYLIMYAIQGRTKQ